MSLDRLALAWLPVAVLFVVTPPIGYRGDGPAQQAAVVWSANRWEIWWRLVEAAGVTLFGALWFDTLGAGGWWVLFFLVGLLVAFPGRLVTWQHADPPRRRALFLHACLDTARYVTAGGLLAWRLG